MTNNHLVHAIKKNGDVLIEIINNKSTVSVSLILILSNVIFHDKTNSADREKKKR